MFAARSLPSGYRFNRQPWAECPVQPRISGRITPPLQLRFEHMNGKQRLLVQGDLPDQWFMDSRQISRNTQQVVRNVQRLAQESRALNHNDQRFYVARLTTACTALPHFGWHALPANEDLSLITPTHLWDTWDRRLRVIAFAQWEQECVYERLVLRGPLLDDATGLVCTHDGAPQVPLDHAVAVMRSSSHTGVCVRYT